MRFYLWVMALFWAWWLGTLLGFLAGTYDAVRTVLSGG